MRNKIYTYAKAVVASLLLSFFLPACSDGEGGTPEIPEGKLAQVTISIAALDESTPAYTKAENPPVTSQDPDQENEDTTYERRIKDWWVVILDGEKKVYEVITNDPNSSNTDPDSETTARVELPVGQTFTFYAFANLNDVAPQEGDGANYIKTLKAGDMFVADKAVSLKAMSEYKDRVYIPMSSYGSDPKTVSSNEMDNTVDLLLIRMLGKVSWTITNGTGQDITVKSLSFKQFRTTGDIYMLPYDAAQGKGTENLLATDMQAIYSPEFPAASTGGYTSHAITLNQALEKDGKLEGSFFANETNFITANDGDGLLLNVFTDIRDDQRDLVTDFDFIRRNDWLKLPILISNAKVEITPSQKHMPIGGLLTPITFDPGTIIADKPINLTHAGELTLTYTLKELNGSNNATDWEFQYYTSSYTPRQQFCNAQIESNGQLILVPERTEENEGSAWDKLPWLGDDKWGYHLTPNDNKISGSFTVNLQELASGTSKIRLTLVAKHKNNGTTVVLPYTLTLNYGKAATTPKGGNS